MRCKGNLIEQFKKLQVDFIICICRFQQKQEIKIIKLTGEVSNSEFATQPFCFRLLFWDSIAWRISSIGMSIRTGLLHFPFVGEGNHVLLNVTLWSQKVVLLVAVESAAQPLSKKLYF